MGAAVSVQSLVPFWKRHGVNSVIDYGAGNLRNACFLKQLGFKVVVVETPEHLKKIQEKLSVNQLPEIPHQWVSCFNMDVDLVLANFVLNIIEKNDEQQEFIANVSLNLKKGGFFLVDVKEKSQRYPEKGFSEEELDTLICIRGFEKIFCMRRRGLLAVLYRKKIFRH